MKALTKFFCALALLSATIPLAAGVPVLKPGQVKVSQEQLRTDVEFLSSDLCEGRAVGTRGGVEAAAYILRRLNAAGLSPRLQSFAVDSVRVGRNIIVGAEKPRYLVMTYYDGLGMLEGRIYPGADSNCSGVAALLAVAERLAGRDDVMFVFLDGHNANMAGGAALRKSLGSVRPALVVNIDIVGSILAPVDKYWSDYIIALGNISWLNYDEKTNKGLDLHIYHTYYRSRSFTDLFFRRTGEQSPFVAAGRPSVLFTSGITLNTNRPSDTAETLDYDVFSRRVEFISRFIDGYGRK